MTEDELPQDLNKSKNTNILWIRATIAANQMNFVLAEDLLKLATAQKPHMGLELALFYLNQWPNPDSEQIKTIQEALVQSEKAITEFDQYLWRQCMAKAASHLLLNEPTDQKGLREQQSTSSDPEHVEREIPAKEISSARAVSDTAIEPVSVAPAAICDPSFNLISVNQLAADLIAKYQRGRVTTEQGLEPPQQFQVIGFKNKIYTIYEAMKPENRNPRVTRLLNYIHHCRLFNNLEQEIRAYQILTREDLRYLLHFDRLLEEMVWTLLHCVNDPQKTGFDATREQRMHTLKLALDLMLICIEYTIKPQGIITKGRPLANVFDDIYLWLDNMNNFDNDPELQQFLRHTLRCRAGSTLGHIYSCKAAFSKRAEMENKARFCFNAKTRFDPNYCANHSDTAITGPSWLQFGNGYRK